MQLADETITLATAGIKTQLCLVCSTAMTKEHLGTQLLLPHISCLWIYQGLTGELSCVAGLSFLPQKGEFLCKSKIRRKMFYYIPATCVTYPASGQLVTSALCFSGGGGWGNPFVRVWRTLWTNSSHSLDSDFEYKKWGTTFSRKQSKKWLPILSWM